MTTSQLFYDKILFPNCLFSIQKSILFDFDRTHHVLVKSIINILIACSVAVETMVISILAQVLDVFETDNYFIVDCLNLYEIFIRGNSLAIKETLFSISPFVIFLIALLKLIQYI